MTQVSYAHMATLATVANSNIVTNDQLVSQEHNSAST